MLRHLMMLPDIDWLTHITSFRGVKDPGIHFECGDHVQVLGKSAARKQDFIDGTGRDNTHDPNPNISWHAKPYRFHTSEDPAIPGMKWPNPFHHHVRYYSLSSTPVALH